MCVWPGDSAVLLFFFFFWYFITDKQGPLNSTFMLNVTVYSASHAPNEWIA